MININLKYDKAAAFASYNECHSTFNVKCASCETNNFASYKEVKNITNKEKQLQQLRI